MLSCDVTRFIFGNVNFDHLAKVVSAGSSITIVFVFPFVIRKHLIVQSFLSLLWYLPSVDFSVRFLHLAIGILRTSCILFNEGHKTFKIAVAGPLFI